jgi:hypothetical protein
MAQDQRDGGGASGAQAVRLFPPRMTRSQPQLATAYAPGAIFTWEGGKGACLSVPIDGAAIDFSARQTRRDQIIESLQECSPAAWGSFAKRPSTSSSFWMAASTIPCVRDRLPSILRSIDLSFCGRNAWATCQDHWCIVATPANSCASMSRRLTRSRSLFLPPVRLSEVVRATTPAGTSSTSCTRIGRAGSRGFHPIATPWIGVVPSKRFRAVSAAPKTSDS